MTPPVSLPGYKVLKDRRALNISTGEIISRRQYDKLSGRLGPYSSYEAKAKANKLANPDLASSRPARGRKSNLKSTYLTKAKNLKSTAGKKFVNVEIPIHYKENGAPDLRRLGDEYTQFVEGLKSNPRAFAVVTQLIFTKFGEKDVRNLLPATTWPTLSQLGIALEEFKLSYDFKGEDKYIALSLHVIFKSQYMKSL